MGLVSGRPLSSQMDLYQPLYVPRPVVEPELFASLRPPTYTGAMDADRAAAAKGAMGSGGAGFGGGMPAGATAANAQRGLRRAEEKAESLGRLAADKKAAFAFAGDAVALNLRQGINSAAAAVELGDFFQYVIEHPVNL